MDQQELDDWRDFCEGTKNFSAWHFSRIFMGIFYPSLNEIEREHLKQVFSYVPNSSRALEKILRIDMPADDRSDQEIIDLVLSDMRQVRRITTAPDILAAIDLGICEVISDEEQFRRVCVSSELGSDYIQNLCDAIGDDISRKSNDKKTYALHEAFYGIATDLHLQHALTADLIGSEIECDNYFELYLIGVDYVLTKNGALVINHRKHSSL